MTERAKKLLWLYYKQSRKIRRVSGLPPLTFKAKKAGTLKNYRIYGNTVNGNSVGDRTANLFDGNFLQGYWAYADGEFSYINTWICTTKISCTGGQMYTYSFSKASRWSGFVWYDGDGNYISTNNRQDGSNTQYRLYYAEAPSNAEFMAINIAGYPAQSANILPSDITDFMLVAGEYTSETMPNYEPYGYKVPVTVEGKNLLQNTATSRTINGVTFTVNSDRSVTCYGTATATTFFSIPMTINQGTYTVSGAPAGCNFETPYVTIRLRTPSGGGDVPPFNNNDFGTGVTISSNKNNNDDYLYKIRVPKDYTCNNITFYPMIRKAGIEDGTYEPYHAPVTTPIYLPEPIKMVGDEAEYIDYAEQKQHFADGTSVDVELPALPTIAGTNTLTVGTEVQPSDVEISGRIKAAGGD